MKSSTGNIHMAGEHFVAAELSLRNVATTMLHKNAKGYDLLAMLPDGTPLSIQVKASGPHSHAKKSSSWWQGRIGPIHTGERNRWWILVDLKENTAPRYFVVPESVMIATIHAEPPGWSTSRQGWEELDLAAYREGWDDLLGADRGE